MCQAVWNHRPWTPLHQGAALDLLKKLFFRENFQYSFILFFEKKSFFLKKIYQISFVESIKTFCETYSKLEFSAIQMIMESGDWLCGGDLEVMERVTWNDGLDRYRLTPNELRARFKAIGVRKNFKFTILHYYFCFFVTN